MPKTIEHVHWPDAPDPWIGMAVRAIVERCAGGEHVVAFVGT